MTKDARAALGRLVAALEAHFTAAQQRRGEQDPHVEQAYRALADAFEDYDEALYDAFDEVTPFVLYDDVEDEREDTDDEDDDVVLVDDDDIDDAADEDDELDEEDDEDDDLDVDEGGQRSEASARA